MVKFLFDCTIFLNLKYFRSEQLLPRNFLDSGHFQKSNKFKNIGHNL